MATAPSTVTSPAKKKLKDNRWHIRLNAPLQKLNNISRRQMRDGHLLQLNPTPLEALHPNRLLQLRLSATVTMLAIPASPFVACNKSSLSVL